MEIYGKSFKILDFDEIKGTCFGFIYVTINNVTGKLYLGLHNTWKRNYLGSGNYMRAAIKKYGKENFTRYIIDTANSYEELVNLEAYYITEAFGINLAESRDWYNITSGLQRGGDTWRGMSEEDRKKRSERISKALKGRKQSKERVEENRKITLKRMKDPKERKKVAEATKLAMANPEIRKRLSEAKRGCKPNYSPEEIELRRQRGKLLASKNLNTGTPWNKGVPCEEDVKKRISETMRSHFKVTLNDKVICEDLSAPGSYQGAAKYLQETFGIRIGKNKFRDLVLSGETYNGLRAERVN